MGARLLVVDDSRVDRRLTEQCLIRSGYKVDIAVDGETALKRLELQPADLVVTDMLMPDIDGIELLRRIKDSDATLPVVLVTSSGSESVVTSALRAGADDFVNKSHLMEQLPASVSRLLDLASDSRRQREAEAWITRHLVNYEVSNDRRLITGLVRQLCDFGMRKGPLTQQDEIRVSVALEEALLNAIIHGNLEVSSELREEEGDAFEQLIALRIQDEYYAQRRVSIECEVSRDEIRYQITDGGPGFDISKLPDPRNPDRILLASGRGILMMRAFMDDVHYSERGNRVTLIKRRRVEPSVTESTCQGLSESKLSQFAGVSA
ncbi:MAG: response regulator [Planctomycetaceae bacterium]